MTNLTQPSEHAEITSPISADLRRMPGLSEQDAGLLEQAASMLEGLHNDERNRGNCSTAEGAACSAHAVRRLAVQLLRAAPPAQACQAAAFLITGGRTYGDGVCISIKEAAEALAVRNDGSRVEVLYTAPAQERAYICPVRTVADLVNNLLLMDQTLPLYGAQYIEHPAGRRRVITVPPTVSRERVKDGRWIGEGDELNAAVVWTRAEQPASHEREPLMPDQLADLCEQWLQAGGASNIVDAYEAGFRSAERLQGEVIP